MNNYMVVIQLPEELTEEFLTLIPKQRAHIDKLMDESKIVQYALAGDRSKLWVIVAASTLKGAKSIIDSFPLRAYMNPKYVELAFYNSISTELPKLIMN
ncbi:MAG: hypothetical protein WBM13_14525 [Bacteroidia bacterium]